jgi:thiosulfate dehydrogenase [quinone] large subunit
MSNESRLSNVQQFALVALRTLIGWHFLYEGYYKLMLPAWGPDGKPLGPWSSAGYLKAASGPVARLFQSMVERGWTPWIDGGVKFALLFVGLSLILGLFTRIGAVVALVLLAMFYVLQIPTLGVPQPGSEGTYLIVNKTLIEAAAVIVLIAFNTGAIAGLDLLISRRLRRRTTYASSPQVAG